jgi:ribose transport system substrate-binding protein
MRPRIALTIVACLLVTATGAGCGGDDSSDSSSGSSNSPAAFKPQPKSGIKGGLLPSDLKLWKYDKSTGKYVDVPGDASKQYQPHDDKAPKPYTFAYAEGWAANPFSVSIHKGVYDLAKKMGIKLIYCDNQFKTDVAISCAEQLAAQHPDFAIESNWQSGVAKQVMAIWDKAKIPAVNVDVWHPNGIFFGANNYDSGVMGGKAAGQYAKKQWDCKDVWVFLGEHLEEGEAADLRLQGFSDGVQEVCGKLPSGNIDRLVMDAGTADQAITKTTDWITAHPQAKHVLATSIDDERATGIAKAFVATQTDGVALGPGCDQVGIEAVKSAPTSENKYLGCVAFYPEKYPDYLMSIGLDVLAGKPVPQEVHIVHKFLDHDTIGEAYP